MTTRLTVWMRGRLQTHLLEHAFSAQVMELIEAQRDFAWRVYNDVLSARDRERMDQMPAGWLIEVSSIGVRLGDGGNEVHQLPFNGMYEHYGELSRALKSGDREAVDTPARRMPYKMSQGVAKVYGTLDPLTLEWDELGGRRHQLKASIRESEGLIKATLNSFSTVPALVKGWPEVAPFVSRFVTSSPAPLPVVPRETLNGLLDLPVEAMP